MNIKKYYSTAFISFALFLILGCGDNAGGGFSEEVSFDNNDSNTTEESTITKIKGYLLDSALEGVSYFCDGEEGLTDSKGLFECANLPVTFKIGSLLLGKLEAFTMDGKVYPQDLLGLARNDYSNLKLKLLTRLFQSLDDDGDITTKITITQSVRDGIVDALDFKDNISETDIKALLNKLGKNIVEECGALKHLGDTNVNCNNDGSYLITVPIITTPTTTPITTSKIKLLSPKSTVDYSYVTLEVKDNVADVKAKVNGVEYIGVKNNSSFLIYNVALKKGKNSIELIADNGSEKTTVEVNSDAKGFAPIVLELDKTEGYDSLEVNAEVKNNGLTITNYLIDKDGNKVIETNSSSATFKLSYGGIGVYSPKVLVRTSDNILYAISASDSVNIIENPLKTTTTVTGASGVQDLEEYAGYIYALTGSSLVKISEDNSSQTETINLSGLSGAKGFAFDSDGNIFVADTGNNKVAKYLASNNYSLDSSFRADTGGAGRGELNSPVDVTVSGVGNSIRVFVLDAGNNRIQIFNQVGAYLADFDGSTTAEGKLSNPLNMIGAGSMIISDGGMIRELSYNEVSKNESGRKILALASLGKVTYSSDGLLVPDNTNKQFIFFDINGVIKKQLPTTTGNLIGMSYENNHQLLQVKSGGATVEHTYVPKTSPQSAPKALAEKFVKAYLDGDDATMLSLTSKANIDRLKKIDTKVKEAFTGMTSYRERIYMNGLKAVANGTTIVSVGEVNIQFNFNWASNKWSLSSIL
jgi:hypothetical protein